MQYKTTRRQVVFNKYFHISFSIIRFLWLFMVLLIKDMMDIFVSIFQTNYISIIYYH